MVKYSRQKKTRAQHETSVVLREDADNPPGCRNLQFLPQIGVYPPDGILAVDGTSLGDDGKLYMASFTNLTIAAIHGPEEQDFSLELPVELFGVSAIDLFPGQPLVVSSVQTDVALEGQIVMTQKNDGTRFTIDVVICPVGIA
ncbi:hypothetical protein [Microvirga massiliensis]|uniref:hypothetical protein n=1 Tax=Microvirga massiliensis TaxID=1033741 RepID=UPI00062B5DB5|nr:hypothetical protein [Microvirga massiliensis]